MISQINFNNKKSYEDFNLNIISVEVGYPTPKLIRETVPFMNGEYDFSNIYEDTFYDSRSITIEFEYADYAEFSKYRLNVYYTEVVNWLYGSGRGKLYIDYEQGYFTGRVINISPIEYLNYGKINVEFICDPIRYSDKFEGDDNWDIFNFELDYAQDTKFNVAGTKTININNPSIHSITPEVICTSEIEVSKNDITYLFKAGATKDWRFKLDKGENILNIKGEGDIEFKFRKEVL